MKTACWAVGDSQHQHQQPTTLNPVLLVDDDLTGRLSIRLRSFVSNLSVIWQHETTKTNCCNSSPCATFFHESIIANRMDIKGKYVCRTS
jgi:hypothetical protein